MKASLSNYRQSPRKVRLVADVIKGKSVAAADAQLMFTTKRTAPIFKKLLASAVANAINAGVNKDELMIADLRVDAGVVLKRFMPRARGSAYQIKKRTSHVTLVLAQKAVDTKKIIKEKKPGAAKAPQGK